VIREFLPPIMVLVVGVSQIRLAASLQSADWQFWFALVVAGFCLWVGVDGIVCAGLRRRRRERTHD
jgi:hypothetical protein